MTATAMSAMMPRTVTITAVLRFMSIRPIDGPRESIRPLICSPMMLGEWPPVALCAILGDVHRRRLP
jgi:hypothetical protein